MTSDTARGSERRPPKSEGGRAGHDRPVTVPTARRRWRTALVWVCASYLMLVLAGTVVLHAGMLVARRLGHGPASPDTSLPPIRHLRAVDGKVLAGAQAGPAHYRRLAQAGVSVVVDLRTGAADDPRRDDPAFLARLGMAYVRLPVPDGRPPDAATVREFARIVRLSDGSVFVHCGGGVGRSASLQSAYEASLGRDPSWLDTWAIGPPTLEQLWFTASAGPGSIAPHDGRVAFVSRLIDAPRRALSRLRARL